MIFLLQITVDTKQVHWQKNLYKTKLYSSFK